MSVQSATANPVNFMPEVTPTRRTYWIDAMAALVGVSALLGQKQVGSAVSSALLGVLTRRKDAHLKSLSAEALANQQPLQDALLTESRLLGAPSQAVISTRWAEISQKAATCFNTEVERLGGEEKVSPLQRKTLMEVAVHEALSPHQNWMSGRALVLSSVVPAAILFYAAQVRALTPFSFVTGTIATTFAAPLLYRLAGRVRVWSTGASDRVRQATQGTPFQQLVSGMGLRGNMQPDLFHSGRWYRDTAQQKLNTIVSDVMRPETTVEAGCRLLALALVDLHASFPEVDIDDLWSQQLALRLGRKFGNPDCLETIRSLAVEDGLRRDHDLRAETLQKLVDATLRPSDWATAAST